MSEHKKINLEEAIEKSPKQYKLSIEYIYSVLLSDEFVIYISKATRHDQYDMGRSRTEYKKDIRYFNSASLIIITNKQWIRRPTYWASGNFAENPILFTNPKEKQNIFNKWKEHPRWAEPFENIPPEGKNTRKWGQTAQEWATSEIKFLPLRKISVSNKFYLFSNQNNIQHKYIHLSINGNDYTFEPEDGEKLFSLLQSVAINNRQIDLGEKNEKSNQIHIGGNVSESTIIIGNENETQKSKKNE